MNWISVKDRLPEPGTGVLICGLELFTCMAHYWEGSWLDGGMLADADEVSHWQPLPDKPAEEG